MRSACAINAHALVCLWRSCHLAHWLASVRVYVAWVANAPRVHHLIVLVLKQVAAAAAAVQASAEGGLAGLCLCQAQVWYGFTYIAFTRAGHPSWMHDARLLTFIVLAYIHAAAAGRERWARCHQHCDSHGMAQHVAISSVTHMAWHSTLPSAV
jgi:hypothetical protein